MGSYADIEEIICVSRINPRTAVSIGTTCRGMPALAKIAKLAAIEGDYIVAERMHSGDLVLDTRDPQWIEDLYPFERP